MRRLPQPTDENAQPYDAGEVFGTCVSMVRSHALKAQLIAVRPKVEVESADYATKAANKNLYQKQPHVRVGTVEASEMVDVYKLRMVPKKSTGRPVYDKIMSQPVNGRCPFCGIGTVNTLDHYLPKTEFPVFSVTPNNLVPACKWCQGEKGEYFPATAGEQLLHPYFDDADQVIWLKAELIESAPPAFRYYADPPAHWTATEKMRVATHLKELRLPDLFASNAGSRLAEIRGRLSRLLHLGGLANVRAHLQEELESAEADHKNSWLTAMFRAAIASDWFCAGGFEQT